MSKKLSLVLALFLASMAAGWEASPEWPQVGVVMAACATAPNCGGDTTTTAALTVDHQTTGGDPVEPDTGETWSITATWSTDVFAHLGCTCQDSNTATATADVSYSSSTGWSVTCTSGCGGVIGSIGICEVGQGCDNANGELGYKLYVDITSQQTNLCNGGNNTYLSKAVFTSTSVDDGITVNETTCASGSSVSPTSQTWTATDNGAFECAFNCTAGPGASVTITYN